MQTMWNMPNETGKKKVQLVTYFCLGIEGIPFHEFKNLIDCRDLIIYVPYQQRQDQP